MSHFSVTSDYVKWGLRLVVGACALVVVVWYYGCKDEVTIERPPHKPPVVSVRPPILDDGNIDVADSSGTLREIEEPDGPGEVELALDIQPSDTTRTLFVRHEPRGWFPEVRGANPLSIEGPSARDIKGITVTQQRTALIGFEPFHIGAGLSVGEERLAPAVYWTPLRVWALHAGPFFTTDFNARLKSGLAVSVELRDRLYIGVSPYPQFAATVYYRF